MSALYTAEHEREVIDGEGSALRLREARNHRGAHSGSLPDQIKIVPQRWGKVVTYTYRGKKSVPLEMVLDDCDDTLIKNFLLGLLVEMRAILRITSKVMGGLSPSTVRVALDNPGRVFLRQLGNLTPDGDPVQEVCKFVSAHIIPHVSDVFGCTAWLSAPHVSLADMATHEWLTAPEPLLGEGVEEPEEEDEAGGEDEEEEEDWRGLPPMIYHRGKAFQSLPGSSVWAALTALRDEVGSDRIDWTMCSDLEGKKPLWYTERLRAGKVYWAFTGVVPLWIAPDVIRTVASSEEVFPGTGSIGVKVNLDSMVRWSRSEIPGEPLREFCDASPAPRK